MALLCMIPCSVSTTLLPPNVSIFEAGCDFRDWIEWDYFIWKKNGRHSMKGKEKEMGSMTIILDDSLKALLINLDLTIICVLTRLVRPYDSEAESCGFESPRESTYMTVQTQSGSLIRCLRTA